jgi:hypothetical protein
VNGREENLWLDRESNLGPLHHSALQRRSNTAPLEGRVKKYFICSDELVIRSDELVICSDELDIRSEKLEIRSDELEIYSDELEICSDE